MKKARVLALAMAAMLGFSGAACNVSAAEAESAVAGGNASVGVNVQLGEMGKSLISMFAPADFSWLNEADINVDATVDNAQTNGEVTFSVNETAIATAKVLADMATLDFQVLIPELSDIVLTGNYAKMMEEAEASVSVGGETEELSESQMQLAKTIAENLTKNPPSEEVMNGLMERYLPAVMSMAQPGETAESYTYTIGDITQEASYMEYVFTAAAAVEGAKQILTTAKDDADLKAILESAVAGTSYEGQITEAFDSGVAKALESLESTEVPEDFQAVVRPLMDQEGGFLGLELDVNGVTMFSVRTAKADPKTGLDLNVIADVNGTTTALNLTGTSTSENGALTGEYVFSMDEQAVASVTVNQAMTDAGFEGHYVVTPIVPETEVEGENSVASMLEGFSLLVDVTANGEGGTLAAEVTMGGSSLGKITLRAADGPTVEASIPEDAQRVALDDDAAMETYMGSMNIETILTNLTAAGMPEEFLNQIMGGGEYDEDYEADEEEEPAA